MSRFINIRVGPGETLDDARAELEAIAAANAQQAIPARWTKGVDPQGKASAQFVCYLFCWATESPEPAATAVKGWFENRLVSESYRVSYKVFEEMVTQDKARIIRDRPGDAESMLWGLLPERKINPEGYVEADEFERCKAELDRCKAELGNSKTELEKCKMDHRQAVGDFAKAVTAAYQELWSKIQ
jgi:hypothetical protein